MKNFRQNEKFGIRNSKKPPHRNSGGFGRGDSDRPQMYQATCSDCGRDCEVPFRPSGDRPVYCKNCFRKNEDGGTGQGDSARPVRRSSGGFGDRDARKPAFEKEMYSATCAECGDRCEVPFRPTGERPVYCRNCFNKGDNNASYAKSNRDFDSRDFTGFGGNPRSEKPMYSAICAECGEECEVPFRPTGEKPVYCRNCFTKSEKAGGAKTADQYKKEFEQLNQKVDSILRRLDALMGQKSSVPGEIPKAASSSAPEKKKAPKKPVTEKKAVKKTKKK